MQSFASHPTTPTPIPPTKITHYKSNTTNLCPTHTKRAQLSPIPAPFLPKNPQKGRNYRLYLRPFCQKTIERAQLSLILTPFLPKNHRKGATIACFGEKYYYLCKKQINHNYYDKQRINRKSL